MLICPFSAPYFIDTIRHLNIYLYLKYNVFSEQCKSKHYKKGTYTYRVWSDWCNALPEQGFINVEIVVLEYIEDNTADAAGIQPCFHGLDGDFGGFVVGKMEFSGGNAAEGDAF